MQPENFAGLEKIGRAWNTPQREAVLAEVFPTLKKISVDFAVMEPASRDPQVRVAAVPMPLKWLDVGSWPSFRRNMSARCAGQRSWRRTHPHARHPWHADRVERSASISSRPIGCEDLIIIHTPDATLVCRKDQAEAIKDLHRRVGKRFGEEFH